MTPSEPSKELVYVASPDEPSDGEDTVSADTLFSDLLEGFASLHQWHGGEGVLRLSEVVNGEPQPGVFMTAEEAQYRRQQRDDLSSDAFSGEEGMPVRKQRQEGNKGE